jgi:hypothetical protein
MDDVVYDVCEFTLDFVGEGHYQQFWSIDQNAIDDGEEVAACITPRSYDQDGLRHAFNSGNQVQAKKFLSLVQQYLPKGLYSDLQATFIPVAYDFYREWEL